MNNIFKSDPHIFEESPISKKIFANTKVAWLWLVARLYIGWIWLNAGWGKVRSDAWIGENSGAAITGFVKGALEKAEGPRPDVTSWYAWFLENVVLTNAEVWSYLVAWGEVLVGAALILGAFTGIAVFFGLVMNFSFLFAGTVSSNPVMVVIGIGLVLAWRVAGYIGLDRYLLPLLGTPWRPGSLVKKGFFRRN